jgi:hypothetical protein
MHSAQTLIDSNLRAHTVDGYTAWHMVAHAHERTIRELAYELHTLHGTNATSQPGCYFTWLNFLGAEVLAEVESDGGNVCNVLINGKWLDAQDVAGERLYEEWCASVAESVREAA